jgi:hypothetical protein
MRSVLCFVAVLLAAGLVAAGSAEKEPAGKLDTPPPAFSGGGEAIEVLDYFDPLGAATWTWGIDAPRYMGNVFVPNGGWYPLAIQRLEVIMAWVDGTGAGTVDRVAVFNDAGTMMASVAGLPGILTGTWVPFTFASPYPEIAAGNFWGGAWQGTGGLEDRPLGGTATAAWTNFNEPQRGIAGPPTSAAPTGWATTHIGSAYPTASAHAVRAVVDTNVPVELMRIDVE